MVGCTALWGWCYLVTCVFLTVVRNKGCGGIVQTHFIFSEFNGRQGEGFFSLLSRWETCLVDLLLQFFTLCSNQFSWPFVTCQVVFVESAPPFFTTPPHEFHCFYRVVRKKINRVLCVCLSVWAHTPIQIW